MPRLYEQLLAMSTYAAENGSANPRGHFNPRPPGTVIDGSGTDSISKYLHKVSPAWVPLREIMRHTGLGYGCAGWALRRLVQTGSVEARALGGKGVNSRYMRYRVKP